MTDKKKWILFAAGSVLTATGAIALIYLQHQSLKENRLQADGLRQDIEKGRELVARTPDLEREVIVQRETDVVVKQILSDAEEVTNFVRTINNFANDAEVAIRSLKPAKENGTRDKKTKQDFDRVGYQIQCEADAFHLMDFLSAFEHHERFVNVTGFKLTGAKRSQMDRGSQPVHTITLDLETYVYHPKEAASEARIDNYQRKRDMLLADIQKRSDELRVPAFDYLGARGRRDPWIDPRLPVGEGEGRYTVDEQNNIVNGLVEKSQEIEKLFQVYDVAENIIAQMKARAQLDEAMIKLDEQLRIRNEENAITYMPALNRLNEEVVVALASVRERLQSGGPGTGPTQKELEEIIAAVERHLEREEYQLALQAYKVFEPRLIGTDSDERRAPLADDLRFLATQAQAVLDFEKIDMKIGGVAVMQGVRPVALINGDTVVAGEFLDYAGELYINDIRSHEIEFVYQGVTLVRRIDDRSPFQSTPSKGRK